MTMSSVTEVVVFRLKSETDMKSFQSAAAEISTLLQSYPGYLNRELGVTEDGTWIDIVHWTTLNHALTASDQIMADPKAQAFMTYIDEQSVTMHHTTPKVTSA
jgi:antibiotic biosynthesis monooxygenase (ABM) superfamily enzyme